MIRYSLLFCPFFYVLSCSDLPSDPCECYDKMVELVNDVEITENKLQMFRAATKANYKDSLKVFFEKINLTDEMYFHCEEIYKSKGRCHSKEEKDMMSLWDCGEYLLTSTWSERSSFYKKTYSGDWERDSIRN